MRVLSAGMIATVLVLLAGTSYTYVALRGAMAAEREAVTASQRVSERLGLLTDDLSFDRATVLEALTEDPSTYGPVTERVDRDTREIDTASAELGRLVPGDELEAWNQLHARVHAVEHDIALALALARRGEASAAEETLDRVSERAMPLFADLAALTRHHGERAHHAIAASEARLHLALVVAVLVSLAIAAAVLIIWAIAVRVLRQQERELARYTRRIEGANRELDAFAGSVAHDLKNVLSPIPLANDLIRAHPDEPVLVERSAERVQRAIANAVDVLEGLLDFARAGEGPPVAETAVVADEVRAVVDELQPLAARVDAALELDVAPDAAVVCGHSLLHVILLNVVGNALKFLEDRPVRRVQVRARSDGAFTVIEVEDTGPGIARDQQERIFAPFYRAPDAPAAGHGIGLATVQRIVARSHGRIEVFSALGRGATFRITLPRVPPEGRRAAHEPRAAVAV